jgi:hypothetical protein
MNIPFVVDINQQFPLRISLLKENRALPFSTDILGAFAFLVDSGGRAELVLRKVL